MFREIDPDKFNTLIEINNQLNSGIQEESVLLGNILSSAMKLTNGEASSLLLINPIEQLLSFEIALGPKGKDVKKFTLELGQGIAGWVAQKNTSLIANDVESDSRYSSNISKDVGFQTRNILAVPMRLKGECIGVIEILNKKNGASFSNEDLKWLEIFATQAGIALKNTRDYSAIQSELSTLKGISSNALSSENPIVYKSESFKKLLDMVHKIARIDSSVLITGESGVGKEVVAREIHLKSGRSNGPFVAINCASIPPDLLESELFGHEKGAFTDASVKRLGKFRQADKGTLFLDEIGEMPLDLQAKILRVIQERKVSPLGGEKPIEINIRIVAATNQDIIQMITANTFRQDLYYRLNVFPLYIPPLRERPEDIEALAKHFLEKFTKAGEKTKSFTTESVEVMLAYDWPGNVRELENTIERAVVLSEDDRIFPSNLQLSSEIKRSNYEGKNLKDALNLFKKYYINKSLEENGGNISKTAKDLEIQRTYLSKLIKELEISKQKE